MSHFAFVRVRIGGYGSPVMIIKGVLHSERIQEQTSSHSSATARTEARELFLGLCQIQALGQSAR
jgi:hypothetical protein